VNLFRSLCSAVRHRLRVVAAAAFCVKVAEPAAGFVEEGWLGLSRASLSGGCHLWQVKIQYLESLGRDPGHWATADGFIPSFGDGCLLRFLSKSLGDGAFFISRCSVSSMVAVVGDGDFR
jgi:hypothetical protein